MNKEFRHTVISTLMVAVLSMQQLFGAYHMFIFHANDFEQNLTHDHELVSSSEDSCDLCAKLNPTPVVYTAETYSIAHGFCMLLGSRIQMPTHFNCWAIYPV